MTLFPSASADHFVNANKLAPATEYEPSDDEIRAAVFAHMGGAKGQSMSPMRDALKAAAAIRQAAKKGP